MSLTSAAQVISDCGLPTDLDVTKINAGVQKAEIVLRDKIGDTKYDALVAGGDTTEKTNTRIAESHIALFFAVPFLNMRVTKAGGFVRGVGFNDSRQDLMTHNELMKYRVTFKKQAMLLIQDILLDDEDESTAQVGHMTFMSIGDPNES